MCVWVLRNVDKIIGKLAITCALLEYLQLCSIEGLALLAVHDGLKLDPRSLMQSDEVQWSAGAVRCLAYQASTPPNLVHHILHPAQALTGDNSTTRMNGRQTLHPMQFAEEVLGFEDHRQSCTNINSSDRDSLGSTSLFRGGG